MNLYAIGCSHTRYVWPTFADILGRGGDYDNFYNWGGSGFGNFAIMNRVIEIVDIMEPEDTIIVQWTYPARFDFHIPGEGWYRGGNLSNNNDQVQNTINSYAFDIDSYEMLTNNYIALTKSYLNSKNINYRMVGADYDVGDMPALSIANDFDIPFRKFLNVRPNVKMIKKESDHHFTPKHHLRYLEESNFTITEKMLHYVQQAEEQLDMLHDWKWIQYKLEDEKLTQRVTYGK